jgi:hypothetical protein
MKLLLWLVQFACGCHHCRLSNVFTIKKRTYLACLECGDEFPYSWELMHSVRLNVADAYAPPHGARHAEATVV